ncbi:Putative ribonuclease H protein At1g65750 [Linum perenne]
MPLPRADAGSDEWVWGGESNGSFSIRSAYNLIRSSDLSQALLDWHHIWKWKGPNKIRHFLWLSAHDRLLTNSARKRRNLTDDGSCPFCHLHEESVIHVLRDCRFAQDAWRISGRGSLNDPNWNTPLERWLSHYLPRDHDFSFGVTCWYLWRSRNERIFETISTSPASVAVKARSWSGEVARALSNDASWITGSNQRVMTEIFWEPGPEGRASAGGLLRDSSGRTLRAFTANLGRCSITRAELRAALIGLMIAWETGHRRIKLQMDSTAAIALFNNSNGARHQHSLEVAQLQDLLGREWTVEVDHIYRDANQAADYLASIGFNHPLGTHEISISDCNLNYFVRLDLMGVSNVRSLSNNS